MLLNKITVTLMAISMLTIMVPGNQISIRMITPRVMGIVMFMDMIIA